jgi:hypothetical protein
MLGDLITRLDQPGVAGAMLSSLDAGLAKEIERRAATVSMAPSEFAAGAVREFVERADDDLWFQLLTIMRRAEDPGLEAIRTILQWVLDSDSRRK